MTWHSSYWIERFLVGRKYKKEDGTYRTVLSFFIDLNLYCAGARVKLE